mgnify:CR=1 FL=1
MGELANQSGHLRDRGPGIVKRRQRKIAALQIVLAFAIGLALTSGSLAALHAIAEPGRAVELIVLIGANLLATIVRFVLLRGWVFHPRRSAETITRESSAQ